MEKKNPQEKYPPTITCKGVWGAGAIVFEFDEFRNFISINAPNAILRNDSAIVVVNNQHVQARSREGGSYPSMFCCILNGMVYITSSFNFTNYEDLCHAYDQFHKTETGFSALADFAQPARLGIWSKKDWDDFCGSGFYGIKVKYNEEGDEIEEDEDETEEDEAFLQIKRNYQFYMMAKQRGYSKMNEFFEARKLGIKTFANYAKFKQSDFYMAMKNQSTSIEEQKQKYQDFLDAGEKAFDNAESYYKAKEWGFDDPKEYADFLQSGCPTKEDYVTMIKRVAKQIADLSKQVKDIPLDVETAWTDGQYGDYFRLQYVVIEKVARLLYLKTFQKMPDEKAVLEDLIARLEDKFQASLVNKEELAEWRRTRNKYAHDSFKITQEIAENAKKFFDSLEKNLTKLLKTK